MTAVPTKQAFQSMVRLNQLKDCPISQGNVKNAYAIFAPNLANISGKTVRQRPEYVETDYVEISQQPLLIDSNVTLLADVIFVDLVPFLVSASGNINLVTIEHVPKQSAYKLGHLLQCIIKVNEQVGFCIQTILMDYEFEKV
jgi:hypothetical protein